MNRKMNIKAITRVILVFIMLAPLTMTAYSAGNVVTLKEIRIDNNGSSIEILTTGNVKTRTFTMSKPIRWVLDISPAVWDKCLKSSIYPPDTSYFDKIRIGQWQKNTARLVLHTKGFNPVIETCEDRIIIKFEKALKTDSSTSGKDSSIQPVKTGEQAQSLTDQKNVAESSTPKEERAKVVEIPKAVEVADSSSRQISDSSAQAQNASKSSTSKVSRENQRFEVLCDGEVTRIVLYLTDDRTFDVRDIRFPDRLVIDYPTLSHLPKKTSLRFNQKSRERLPIGLITYVSVFESQDVPGYNRLVFEADQRFTYKTSVENNLLNIDVRPVKFKENIAQEKETVNKGDFKKAIEISSASQSETGSVQETNNTEPKESDAQKLIMTNNKRSFLIKKGNEYQADETGHTKPESSADFGFRLKALTAKGDSRTVSVQDTVGTLPEFAKTQIKDGGEALKEGNKGLTESSKLIANEPLMIEPPEEFKPLPKGTRPAADLFLTKGESVIVPVKGLVRASVGDPDVLVVNVLSQEELLITAKGFGQTTLITWEEGIGRSVRWVNVGPSNVLRTIELERVINNPAIKVSFIGEKSVVLEGKVGSEEEKKRAELIAGGVAEKVINLIEMTDPKRVLVKVRVVEIQNREKEDFLKQLGSGTRTESGDFQFNVLSDILDPEFPGGGIFNVKVHPSIVRGRSGDERFDPIDIALNYLEQTRKGRVLSQPNLVVLSGGKAHFRVGGEVPYTYQNENGVNVVDFREFGIVLDVEPRVDSDNNIWLHVEPVVRTIDNALAIAGIPGFRTREVKTDIQVKDGQTIVIGGLLQHEIAQTKSEVPVLSDIPLVGELFKSKKSVDEQTELLVFLTPSVLKDISLVEGEIRNEADVTISPFYKREVVEGMKED